MGGRPNQAPSQGPAQGQGPNQAQAQAQGLGQGQGQGQGALGHRSATGRRAALNGSDGGTMAVQSRQILEEMGKHAWWRAGQVCYFCMGQRSAKRGTEKPRAASAASNGSVHSGDTLTPTLTTEPNLDPTPNPDPNPSPNPNSNPNLNPGPNPQPAPGAQRRRRPH